MKTRSPLTGDKHTAAEYEAAKEEPVELRQPVPANWRRRISSGRCAASWARCSAPMTERLPRGRHRRLQGHHDARLEDAEGRREVGLRGGPRTQRQEPVGDPDQPQDPRLDRSWILGLRGHNINNAAAGRHRLPDRRGPRLRRVGAATRPRATRSSSRSSTSSPTAGASRGRRSSRSTTPSASTTRRSPPRRCSWTSPRTSVAASPRPRPTSSSAARSASARRSSSRSTSRPSRRRS